MRILYIDHYAGSASMGMEYRPYEMAVEWKRMGDHTTILAGSYSHLRRQNPEQVAPLEPLDIDGVQFRFLPTRSYVGNGVSRVLSMFDFVVGGLRAAKSIVRQVEPDVVISSSTYPFDTWLAQRICRISGARLIHEIHDLWPMTPIELGGHSPRHPLMWLMARAERSAYRRSQCIVSILPNAEAHVRSLGVKTPVVAIPNGIGAKEEHEEPPVEFLSRIRELRSRGRRVIGYAGGMNNANAMDDFMEAMVLLKEYPVSAVLLGDGVHRSSLEARAEESGAAVEFVGTLPKSQVQGALRLCDALFIGSKISPLYEYGVSANKIFDYMLTGVPVVNAFDGEHSPLVYSGCSIRARSEDPEDIARAVMTAVSLEEGERVRLGSLGVDWVRQHHAIDTLARRFRDVLAGEGGVPSSPRKQ